MSDSIDYEKEQEELHIIAQLLYIKVEAISDQLTEILDNVRNDKPPRIILIKIACCNVVLKRIVQIESVMELMREIEKDLSIKESK